MSITSRHTASSHVHDKARSFPETYSALARKYRACSSSRGVKQGRSIPNRTRQHGQPHSLVAVIVFVDTERLTRRRYQDLIVLAGNSVGSLLAEQDDKARRKWYVFRFLLPRRRVSRDACCEQSGEIAHGRRGLRSNHCDFFKTQNLLQVPLVPNFQNKIPGWFRTFCFFLQFAFYRQYFYFLFSHRGIKILAYVYLCCPVFFTLFL